MFQLWLDMSKVPVVFGCEMWPTHLSVRLTELSISKEFLVPVKIWFLLEFLEAVYELWVTFLNSVYNQDKIHLYVMMIICLGSSSVVFCSIVCTKFTSGKVLLTEFWRTFYLQTVFHILRLIILLILQNFIFHDSVLQWKITFV